MIKKKIFRFDEKALSDLAKLKSGLGCKSEAEAIRISIKQMARRFQ